MYQINISIYELKEKNYEAPVFIIKRERAAADSDSADNGIIDTICLFLGFQSTKRDYKSPVWEVGCRFDL